MHTNFTCLKFGMRTINMGFKYYKQRKNLKNLLLFIRKIIFNIISSIAPGTPNNPTNIEVIIFKPIWKLKLEPIIFII